jgi:primosomal replication protein N
MENTNRIVLSGIIELIPSRNPMPDRVDVTVRGVTSNSADRMQYSHRVALFGGVGDVALEHVEKNRLPCATLCGRLIEIPTRSEIAQHPFVAMRTTDIMFPGYVPAVEKHDRKAYLVDGTNEVRLSGVMIESPQLRFAPRGTAIATTILEHTDPRAHSHRIKVRFEGDNAELVESLEVGAGLVVEGQYLVSWPDQKFQHTEEPNKPTRYVRAIQVQRGLVSGKPSEAFEGHLSKRDGKD